ncbi:uncharacterized protein V2V93DRAFT_374339 [Kockiozyma suomiensis]|uniref:uncharacterized protein n=1 Tax=Kockiozyma suomiensis TaxID=1337062 RepID=UPI0033433DC9
MRLSRLIELLAFAAAVAAEAKTPGIFPLRPWTRTAPDASTQIVTPLLVEGVTISPRPPAVTPTIAMPWVSLKPNGAPVTIKPKIKKEGYVEKASPSYGTWFPDQTAVVDSDALGSSGAGDEAAVDEVAVDEGAAKKGSKKPAAAKANGDKQVVMSGRYFKGEFERLNPVIRCTPERYILNGDYAPFCTPDLNTELLGSHSYFVTWYSHYFNSSKVRLNLLDYDTLSIAAPEKFAVAEEETTLKEYAFFTTEWLDNELGYYFLEINPAWLGKSFFKSVYIQIETPEEATEDLDIQHVPIVKFLKGPKVIAASKARYDVQTWEMILAIPLCVLGFIIFLVAFHFCTARARRIGKISIGGHKHDRKRNTRSRRGAGGYEKLEEGASASAVVG